MLTEYNKFIKEHLKGGKMDMKTAAKLWKARQRQTFRYRDEEFNEKSAKVEDEELGLLVELEFKKYTAEKYKERKIINKLFKDGEFALSLDSLYNGKTPKGTARRILCSLLSRALQANYVREDDLISLFAIGGIDDSYVQLLRMYSRMGFEVYGTKYVESDVFEDIALAREPKLLSSSALVLMGTSVGKLLEWCKGRY